MTSSYAQRVGTCACLVAIAVTVAGCGGGSTSAAKAPATGSSVASGVSSGQKAGGRDFCSAIEESVKQPTPTSGDTKTLLDTEREEGKRALSLAPSALKADVTVLNDASDRVYEALEKVDFDYSKLTSTDLAVLSGKDVAAAELHLTAYLAKTCGLDVTSTPGATPPTSAATTAVADPAAAGGGSACDLATADQVAAAVGKPVTPSGATDSICTFSATSDPGLFVYVQIYADKQSMGVMTQIEGISDHVAHLGDDAFWAGPAGVVFVRKGDRAFSLSIPSLANLSGDPDAVKSRMLTLAAQALANF